MLRLQASLDSTHRQAGVEIFSPYGHVKTWLMEVIEENGMPMHLMVDDREEKTSEVKLMKFLHQKCKGKAFMGDGVIRSPFATDHDGPLGFRFFGIAGARYQQPQVFDVPKTYLTGISALEKMKYAKEAA